MPFLLIAPNDVRYIKMGGGSQWFSQTREQEAIRFGYHTVGHEDALAGDVEGIRTALAGRKSEGAVTAGVTEVLSFYQMSPDCLWIRFAEGNLWWAFAEPEIEWLGGGHYNDGPSRRPMTNGPWRNTDIQGRPLPVNDLSSKLTQTANYRATRSCP